MELEPKQGRQAEFLERTTCVACDSEQLETLDSGRFGEGPHRTMIESSPWGESPLPFLEDCEWVLVRCRDCSQVFHRRILTPEWEERRFTEWMTAEAIQEFERQRGSNLPAAVFDKSRGIVDHLLCLEKMTRELRGGDALRVLDFGCGWGRFIAFAALFGFEAHGVDRSTARRDLSLSGGTIHESMDALEDAESRPFHAATLFQVLEHLESPGETLRAIHRRLCPDAVLILEVPDGSGVERLDEHGVSIVDGIDHINAFSPQTLRGIAKKAGFRPVLPVTAHVTADGRRVLKREVRRIMRRLLPGTTNQYFRRT